MIELVTVTARRCTCKHCKYQWLTLGQRPPERCPECRARTWNENKKPGRRPSIETQLTMPKPKRVSL